MGQYFADTQNTLPDDYLGRWLSILVAPKQQSWSCLPRLDTTRLCVHPYCIVSTHHRAKETVLQGIGVRVALQSCLSHILGSEVGGGEVCGVQRRWREKGDWEIVNKAENDDNSH